jgi:hypothetical protein
LRLLVGGLVGKIGYGLSLFHRLMDIGYTKEVLGAIVLTDDGFARRRSRFVADPLLFARFPQEENGD